MVLNFTAIVYYQKIIPNLLQQQRPVNKITTISTHIHTHTLAIHQYIPPIELATTCHKQQQQELQIIAGLRGLIKTKPISC